MTSDDVIGDVAGSPALRRVVERAGGSELVDLLADEISGADLTTLLLLHVQIRLTCLDEAARSVIDQVRDDLAGLSDVEVVEGPDRTTGRGYYTGICFKVYADIAGQQVEIGDGGFVDWSQLLLGNRKERLLISGYGIDRLAGPGRAG